MKIKRLLSLLISISAYGLFTLSPALAQLVPGADNEIFFNGFENVYDSNGVLKPLGSPLAVGDHFVSIVNVQNIDVNGSTVFHAGPQDQLTGISVQRITAISSPDPFPPGQPEPHVTLGAPTVSQFCTDASKTNCFSSGLTGGEMLAFYRQTGPGTTVFTSGGPEAADVARATDGQVYLTLGLAPGSSGQPGYFYAHTDGQFPPPDKAYAGINAIVNNTGFPFAGINDPNESELGGSSLLSDVVLTNEIEINPNGTSQGGQSPWQVRINDPATVHPINLQTAKLGDFVWVDCNGNGIQDDAGLCSNGGGFDGVTVKLLDCSNSVIATTTTSGGGLYLFDNLPAPACYRVEFVKPGGYEFTTQNAPGSTAANDSDANPATGRTTDINLAPGDVDLTWDAGLYQPAALGDFFWLDTDKNGLQDGAEPGIDNVPVDLFRYPNVDCTGALPGTPIASALTAGGGKYLFSPLLPGCYLVKFTAPSGYVYTQRYAPTGTLPAPNPATDSNVDGGGSTDPITLLSGQTDLTIDAGVFKGELGDFCWEDKNFNGKQDPGEPGIPGCTVKLGKYVSGICQPGSVGMQMTDGSGIYGFSGLPTGQYCMQFTPPAGFCPVGQPKFTVQNAAGTTPANDSDVDAAGVIGLIPFTAGTADLTWDAGIYCPAALGDRIWQDDNQNGQQDGGEPGVPGLTVALLDCSGNPILVSGMPLTTTTGANGIYGFTDLKPGGYIVQFSKPGGYTYTQRFIGNPATDSNADQSTGKSECVTLASGEVNLTVDAGVIAPPPPQCSLDVNKLCLVVPPPPSSSFVCSDAKPIDSLSMIWNGTTPVNIKAWKGSVGSTLLATVNNVQPGQTVTVTGFAGSPNDVYWEIFDTATGVKLGLSTFHLSCSDPDMNGPEDCGKPEGNGKPKKDGSSGPGINSWLFEGMGGNGHTLQCTVQPPVASVNSCDFSTPAPPHCKGKVLSMTLRYLGDKGPGADCTISNPQSGKATCSGDIPNNLPVKFVVDPTKYTVSPSGETVVQGDFVTLTTVGASFPADTLIKIQQGGVIVQTLKVHTSCSQPLNLGDQFGATEVVGLNTTLGGTASIGAQVQYDYSVTNTSSEAFVGSAVDDKLGSIFSNVTLQPGQTKLVTRQAFVIPDASNVLGNTVTVQGNLVPSGSQCSANASATVTRTPPPPTFSSCADAKPIDSISMLWNGTKAVNVKAWKGSVGSTLLATVNNVQPGDTVTVTGYAGSPNDVYWEIFDAVTNVKLGVSTFHLSCSDADMNGPEDCGKPEGDGKGLSGFINTWIFRGLSGNGQTLICMP